MTYSQPAPTFHGKCEACGQVKPDCQPVMPERRNPYVMNVCQACRHGEDDARIERDDEAERAWQDMFNQAMTAQPRICADE
jgi:hypothetical protein